jgi:hypothetical protein
METNIIIAGKEIAGFQLGWTLEDLLQKIGTNYTSERRSETTVIYYKCFTFFILDHDNKVEQITVGMDFQGKFLGKIGIGSTLQDVEKYIGKWEDDLDVYIVPQYKGICFELADNGIEEEWIEELMPIEWISIYEPK